MARYYPPVGFHFLVEVLGINPGANDMRFTEVGGLSVEVTTEEVPEGGENRFIQKYPGMVRYPELVLKRGLMKDSGITDWIRESLAGPEIKPKNIDVKLLNDKHEPLMTWHVVNAFPTKWNVSDLNASNNAIVVESLHFYYQYFTIDKS